MSVLAPALFVSHGGGPMLLLGYELFAGVGKFLRSDLHKYINLKEWKAIILVTAHWEETQVTISSGKHPEIYFDYEGFPPECYKYKYDAPGDHETAQRVFKALMDAGIAAKLDSQRGWDHGAFVPMMLINPDADIPIIQVSILANQDAKQHYEFGKVLQQFRKEGIAVLGSGMTYHNMQKMLSCSDATAIVNEEFDDYLTKVCTAENESERKAGLIAWRDQPGSSEAHPPNSAEHLMPLIVTAGAGGSKPAERIFNGDINFFRLTALLQCRNHAIIDVETALEAAEAQTTDNKVGRRQLVPIAILGGKRGTQKSVQKPPIPRIKEVQLKTFHQAECKISDSEFPCLDPLGQRTE